MTSSTPDTSNSFKKRALGDYLIVSFASEEVLWHHKKRKPSIPDAHKKVLLESLRMVDCVIVGRGMKKGLDFEDEFLAIKPHALVVTEDDLYTEVKRELCSRVGAEYIVLPKTPPKFPPVSTTLLVNRIKAPTEVPLRVDFAGGWLDVPAHARPGDYVVNCAVTPMVSLRDWPYEKRSGMGGSGAWAILEGRNPVEAELGLGVGWQDPAVIRETGCCVWRSGPLPVLDMKSTGDFLDGRMAIIYTGVDHDTPSNVNRERDYERIAQSALIARTGVLESSVHALAAGINLYYSVQLDEGMKPLAPIEGSIARKYLGGGHGGYALYLFSDPTARETALKSTPGLRPVEPYCRKPV
ncbi:MAG: cytidyltransferase [Akkermansiaceae bacterium]|nr:cytidyltransferase [Akkermansiaceae bacterium]